MMRRILLIVMCLFVMVAAKAQSDTEWQQLLEGMCDDEIAESIEQQFEDNGIECTIRTFYSKDSNRIIYSYQFYDKRLYDAFDLSEGKKGAVRGMIMNVLQIDPSGEALQWMIDAFDEHDTKLVFKVLYMSDSGRTYEKSAVVTPSDMRKMASALF